MLFVEYLHAVLWESYVNMSVIFSPCVDVKNNENVVRWRGNDSAEFIHIQAPLMCCHFRQHSPCV
jgi:hypothetical protein